MLKLSTLLYSFARNKQFICGNWKSNNSLQESLKIVNNITNKLEFNPDKVDVVIAPPAIHIPQIQQELKHPKVKIGSQNCSAFGFGAYTGQLAPKHLQQFGVEWVIIGHSERRALMAENNDMLVKKVKNALGSGLKVIFCIGQTIEERKKGLVESVLSSQLNPLINALPVSANLEAWLKNLIVAYEPVWAIGTGLACQPKQTLEVFTFLREKINWNHKQSKEIRILYGGSANAKNTSDYLKIESLDGLLVGGASLKEQFKQMVNKCSSI